MEIGSDVPTDRVADSETFLKVLEQGGCPSAAHEVRAQLGCCKDASQAQVRVVFSRLGRRVEPTTLRSSLSSRGWTGLQRAEFFQADIVAKMAFLFGLCQTKPPTEFVELFTVLYRAGSQREQVSVLRSLPFLPRSERFVFLASEACRTNDVTVFSALASDNPFPAARLADAAFFQMVLKAMFLGVDNAHTLGLARRTNDELVRMVRDFAKERAAAGRTIPKDAQALLASARDLAAAPD